jgi:hypothetical protein
MPQEDIHIHVHVHTDSGVDYTPRFNHLETMIMALADDLTALNTEFNSYQADVLAALTALQTQITDLQGQIATGDPAVATAAAALKTSIDTAVANLGDANGDGTPAAPAPEPTA